MKQSIVVGALALALGLAGCGDSLDVNNTSPTGAVGGVVVDANTRAALPGVSVTVIAGGRVFGPELSGEDGSFSLTGVPAGNVIVTMTLDVTHQDIWLTGTLSNAAGEFPTGNATLTLGPIGMVPLSNPVAFRVLDFDGTPVSGYEVAAEHVQHVDFKSGTGIGIGKVVSSGVTDTSGFVTFDLPNFHLLGSSVNSGVVILLPPRDGNADGIYEFAGGDRFFNMRDFNDPTPDIVLDANYTTSLQIVTSTVRSIITSGVTAADSPSVLPNDAVIFVKFNLPIESMPAVSVSDEFGDPIAQAPTTSVNGDVLTIRFDMPLLPGEEFNIVIHPIAAVGGRIITGDFFGPFFTAGLNPVVSAVITFHDPGTEAVTVEFSEPVGFPTSGVITLASPNCVLFFNANLAGDATIGDAANERGADTCSVHLISDEPVPIGLGKRSGFTKFWRFTAPTGPAGTLANTLVDFEFERVFSSGLVIEDTSGQPLGNITDVIMP